VVGWADMFYAFCGSRSSRGDRREGEEKGPKAGGVLAKQGGWGGVSCFPLSLCFVSCRKTPRPSLRRASEGSDYWQASQASGFSKEHAIAASGVTAALTVVFAIRVAGRERR